MVKLGWQLVSIRYYTLLHISILSIYSFIMIILLLPSHFTNYVINTEIVWNPCLPKVRNKTEII